MSEKMKYCFGVDVGGTTIKMGLFQETGVLMDKWEIVTRKESDGEYILPDIAASISAKLVKELREKSGAGMKRVRMNYIPLPKKAWARFVYRRQLPILH